MFRKKGKLEKTIEKLNNTLTQANLAELVCLLGNKKQILIRNLIAGITRGIGIGIGFTIITAIIIIILQRIIRLNIPVISEYIKDIMEIIKQ